jgi:replicative DNA helicase
MSDGFDAEYVHRIEAACIGALVLTPKTLDDVPWLRAEDFAYEHFGRWLTIIRERHDAGDPVDLVTLYTEMRRRDDLGPGHAWVQELTTLTDNVPLPGFPVPYAQAVVEESIRRQVEAVGIRIAQLSRTGDPGEMLADVARQDRVIGEAQVRWVLVSGGEACSPREWDPVEQERRRDESRSFRGSETVASGQSLER